MRYQALYKLAEQLEKSAISPAALRAGKAVSSSPAIATSQTEQPARM
jgi:hypothetical protein